jgi:hypothetical protein
MKKFILSLVAVLAVSVSSFAAENTNVDKTTVKNKMNKMESALQMDGYQSSVLEDATISLQEAIQDALQNNDEAAKKQEIKKAVNKNLRNASRVLNMNQYKKYLQILNVTLQNNKIADYTK